jgi:hypothetical protein
MLGRFGPAAGEGSGSVRRVLRVMRRFSLSASSSPSSGRVLRCGPGTARLGRPVLAHAVLQEAMVAPVRRRLMTEVIAHRTREREEAGRFS